MEFLSIKAGLPPAKIAARSLRLLACCALFVFTAGVAFPQSAAKPVDIAFRIGERLTYNVSFERFPNVAYAETYVVSAGKLGDKSAIELRSKIKTLDLVSAAFFFIDESRTTFAAPDTGIPLYVRKKHNIGGIPKETIDDYLTAPAANLDLLTLIYRIRLMGGNGSLTLEENDRTYSLAMQVTGAEKARTDAGEYDTSIVSLQSDYLTEQGFTDVRLSLSTDDTRLPVLLRFRTAKGSFRVSLSSVQNIPSEPEIQPTPSATPVIRPNPTPKPPPTAEPYVDNEALSPELSFTLGEVLDYRLLSNGQPIGKLRLHAKERKQIQGRDSLVLAASIVEAASSSSFRTGDEMRTQVDPDTLTPRSFEMKFSGPLASFSQIARSDERSGTIIFGGNNRVDVPVGTHNILSLIYAVRSFNLKPSRDTSNPINDTRVAVFWETRPYIFTLRPAQPEVIILAGQSVTAQQVTVSTGNTMLDQLGIKIWLSNDLRRLPLRIAFGNYQAELISENTLSK